MDQGPGQIGELLGRRRRRRRRRRLPPFLVSQPPPPRTSWSLQVFLVIALLLILFANVSRQYDHVNLHTPPIWG